MAFVMCSRDSLVFLCKMWSSNCLLLHCINIFGIWLCFWIGECLFFCLFHESFVAKIVWVNWIFFSFFLGGRNGYGAKLCNIFSTKFIVETSSDEYRKAFKQVLCLRIFSAINLVTSIFKSIMFFRVPAPVWILGKVWSLI